MKSLQRPLEWPKVAKSFSSAMAGNGTALYNAIVRPLPLADLDSPEPHISPRLAVTCLDSPRPTSPDEFPTAEDLTEQGLKALREVSPHFGLSTGVSEPDGGCQYWPVDGPERFTGPWNATLETKMLIVSNTVRASLSMDECHSAESDISCRLTRKRKFLLENSYLIVVNRITPKSSGLLVNSLMPDSSVIIIQDGPGVRFFFFFPPKRFS